MKKQKRKIQSEYDGHFKRIDATPEELAEAVLRTSPQQLDEWRTKKKTKAKQELDK